jgi:hypothetical protein
MDYQLLLVSAPKNHPQGVYKTTVQVLIAFSVIIKILKLALWTFVPL